MNLYSICDFKANEWGPVFEAKNDDVAIRKCKLEFSKAPVEILPDYALYRVGIFDSDTGHISTTFPFDEKQGVDQEGPVLVLPFDGLFENPAEEAN